MVEWLKRADIDVLGFWSILDRRKWSVDRNLTQRMHLKRYWAYGELYAVREGPKLPDGGTMMVVVVNILLVYGVSPDVEIYAL